MLPARRDDDADESEHRHAPVLQLRLTEEGDIRIVGGDFGEQAKPERVPGLKLCLSRKVGAEVQLLAAPACYIRAGAWIGRPWCADASDAPT